MSEFRGKDPDAVVICNTFVASEIIAAEKIAKEQSFDLFFPILSVILMIFGRKRPAETSIWLSL